MYSVAPCDLPVSWSPSGWEPQSHCDFGRLRCHGSTCKEHYRFVISHSTITPCGKKNNDVVRLVRASECEVDGDDICSAAFARRWRGFVVAVHRAFAILAQERAIVPLSLLLPLAVATSCWKYSSTCSFHDQTVRSRFPCPSGRDKS